MIAIRGTTVIILVMQERRKHGSLTTVIVTPKMCTNEWDVQPPGPTILLTILVTDIAASPMIINVRRAIRTFKWVSSNPSPGV
jgi:hypothetical protein